MKRWVLSIFTFQFFLSAPLLGVTRYFCPSSGNWNNNANWDTDLACSNGANGIPAIGDDVVIPSGRTVQLDIEGVIDINSLVVESTATLQDTGSRDIIKIHGANSSNEAIKILGTLNLIAETDWSGYSVGTQIMLDPSGTGTYTVDFSGLSNANQLTTFLIGEYNAPACSNAVTYNQVGNLYAQAAVTFYSYGQAGCAITYNFNGNDASFAVMTVNKGSAGGTYTPITVNLGNGKFTQNGNGTGTIVNAGAFNFGNVNFQDARLTFTNRLQVGLPASLTESCSMTFGNTRFDLSGDLEIFDKCYTKGTEVYTFKGTVDQIAEIKLAAGNYINEINIENITGFVDITDTRDSGGNNVVNITTFNALIPNSKIRFRDGISINITNFNIAGGSPLTVLDRCINGSYGGTYTSCAGTGTWNITATNHSVNNVACNNSDATTTVGGIFAGGASTLNACVNWNKPTTKYCLSAAGCSLTGTNWSTVGCGGFGTASVNAKDRIVVCNGAKVISSVAGGGAGSITLDSVEVQGTGVFTVVRGDTVTVLNDVSTTANGIIGVCRTTALLSAPICSLLTDSASLIIDGDLMMLDTNSALKINYSSHLKIGGNFIVKGSITPGNSTVTLQEGKFSTDRVVDIGISSLYNLIVNSTTAGKTWILQNPLRLLQDLTLTNGQLDTSTANYAMTVNNDVIFNGGTLLPNASIIQVGGNWNFTSGSFGSSNQGMSSTVEFTSTTTGRTIRSGSSQFFGIRFSGIGGGWQLLDNLTVLQNFGLDNGTFSTLDLTATSRNVTVNGNLIIGNSDANSATFTANASTITVAKDFIVNSDGTFTPGTSSVVLNDSTGPWSIQLSGSSFNNIAIQGGATRTLQDAFSAANLNIQEGTLDTNTTNQPMNLTGNLTIGDAAGTLAQLNANNSIITIAGNLALDNTDGKFVAGNSTVQATGTGNITGTWSGGNEFWNLEIAYSGQTTTIPTGSQVKVLNLLTTHPDTASAPAGVVSANGDIEVVDQNNSAGTTPINVAASTDFTGSGMLRMFFQDIANNNGVVPTGLNSSANTLNMGVLGPNGITVNLSGPVVTTGMFMVAGDSGGQKVILNTNDKTINVGKLQVGVDLADGVSFTADGEFAETGIASGEILITSDVVFRTATSTISLDNALLQVKGNWDNTVGGTFNAGTSTVLFNGTLNQTITGSTTFNTLNLYNGNNSRQIQFRDGDTFTVTGTINIDGLTGGTGNILIRSQTAGTPFTLNFTGTRGTLNNMDVADATVTGTTPLVLAAANGANLVDSGNTTNWFIAIPNIIARETVDSDGNGFIDRIRLTASQNLNDSFGGITITVSNHSVPLGGVNTGSVANDAIFEVLIDERPTGLTDETPDVQITGNTSLKDVTNTNLVPTDGTPVTTTDKAGPAILAALGGTGSSNILIFLSEPADGSTGDGLATNTISFADFTYNNNSAGGSTAISSISDQDGTDKKIAYLVLNANPSAGDLNNDSLNCAGLYDANDNPGSTTYVPITNIVYVHATNGQAGWPGTQLMPLNTITQAVATNAHTSGMEVHVAGGTYNVDSSASTQVVLKEGVNLYGGYDPANWATARNPSTYTTTIQDTAGAGGTTSSPLRAIEGGAGITSATLVDGFTIRGGSGTDSSAIFLSGGASPTIRNNTIDGGSGSTSSQGIHTTGASTAPTITANSINGGTGGNSYGIYAEADSDPVIDSNTLIDGGSGSTNGDAIYAVDAGTNVQIINNANIVGGSGGTGLSRGVYIGSNATATISNNSISGGNSAKSRGIVAQTSSNVTISNNSLISGGTSTAGWVYGIVADSVTGSVTISGNTNIYAGNATSGTNNAVGIEVVFTSNVQIIGNTVDGGQSLNRTFAIGITGSSSSATMEKNRLLGGSGSNISMGISFKVGTGTAKNNLIHAGTSPADSRGVQIWNNSANLYNNTIYAGSATQYAIFVHGTASSSDIRNNILFCNNGASSYGIYEDAATSDPGTIQNNNIFDCATLYQDEGSVSLTSISAVNALSDITSGNNYNVDMVGGPNYFTDLDGADNNINTMGDNDWSLVNPIPLHISGTGQDLSGAGVTDDFTGAARTAPYSLGAYENDGASLSTVYSMANGNWENNTSWSFGACGGAQNPSGDYPDSLYDVVVCDANTITINENSSAKNLTIGGGTGGTLVMAAGGYSLNVSGNWSANTGATFTANDSTVILSGSAAQSLKTNGQSFNHLEMQSGTYTMQDALTLTGNLTINGGTLDTDNANNYPITVSGNVNLTAGALNAQGSTITLNGTSSSWNASGGTFNAGTSIVEFQLGAGNTGSITGSANFNILRFTSGGVNFPAATVSIASNLDINTADIVSIPDGGTVNVTGNFSKTAGTLNIGAGTSGTLSVSGTFTHSGGTIVPAAGAQITGQNASFAFYTDNTYGTVIPDNPANVGYYAPTNNVFIQVVDPNRNLDAGALDTITVTLVSNNTTPENETLTLTETGNSTGVFTTGAIGVSTAVAAIVTGDGIIQVADGDVISFTYSDPYDTSDNNGTNPYETKVMDGSYKRWDGGAGTNSWADAANWAPDGVPTFTDDIIFDHSLVTGAYTVSTSGATRQAKNLTIAGSNVTISGTNIIQIKEHYFQSAGTVNVTVEVTGNGAGPYHISQTGGTLKKLSINGGTNTYQLTSNLTLSNFFNMGSGTFQANGYNITASGLMQSGGIFSADTGSHVFNSANITGGTFNANTSTIDINGNLTLAGGATTFNSNSATIQIAGNLSNGSTLNPGTSTWIFDGSATQTIDIGTNGSFYNLTSSNTLNGVQLINNNVTINNQLQLTTGSFSQNTQTVTTKDLLVLDGAYSTNGQALTINGNLSLGDGVGAATSAILNISNSTVSIAGNATANTTDGQLVSTGSTTTFTGNSTITGFTTPNSAFGNLVLQGGSPQNLTLGSDLTAIGQITFNSSGSTLNIDGGGNGIVGVDFDGSTYTNPLNVASPTNFSNIGVIGYYIDSTNNNGSLSGNFTGADVVVMCDNRTVTMTGNIVTNKNFNVRGTAAGQTCTLQTAGFTIAGASISVGSNTAAPFNHSFTSTGVIQETGGTINETFTAGSVVFVNNTSSITLVDSQWNVSTNWDNSLGGSFTSGNSLITFNGTGTQGVFGANTFNNLTFADTGARDIVFTAGSTTTVNGAFTANATSGNEITIKSDTPGSKFTMDLKGSLGALAYLQIQDSDAISSNSAITFPINPLNSTNLGNTTGWFDTTGPNLASAVTRDTNGNGYIDRIELTFNENVNEATINAAQFTVTGATVASVGDNGTSGDAVIWISLTDGVLTTDATPAITINPGGIQDMYGNDNQLVSGFVPTDGAGPAILSAVAKDELPLAAGIDAGDTVTITFSEAISSPPAITSANVNTLFNLGLSSWLDGSGNIGSAVWGSGNTVLTITLSTTSGLPTVAVGNSITLNGTLQDSSGNSSTTTPFNSITGTFDTNVEKYIVTASDTRYPIKENFTVTIEALDAANNPFNANETVILTLVDSSGNDVSSYLSGDTTLTFASQSSVVATLQVSTPGNYRIIATGQTSGKTTATSDSPLIEFFENGPNMAPDSSIISDNYIDFRSKQSLTVAVNLTGSSTVRAELYDIKGRKIKTLFETNLGAGKNFQSVNLKALGIRAGLYTVRIKADRWDKDYSYKIIVIR